MIERYIDQIITMEILADVITIIDDKGIIRYYKTLRPEGSVFSANEVVGQHFMEVFPHIKKEESTVLRALEGKTTLYKPCKMTDFKGDEYDILECVYPIQIKECIIGAACISRRMDTSLDAVKLNVSPEGNRKGYTLPDIIGISQEIQNLKMQIMQVADSDVNVLICGETGTGKEMVAEAIHNLGTRSKKMFYSQNCAAIPSELLESIVFGTKKGIYTGAIDRSGILEQAEGGTVLFDEINSLDLSLQAKLLKVIEEKKFRRPGGEKEIETNIRVIAATNEDPFKAMKDGKIRSDLFYRLSSIIIEVPPLRERKEDIPILADYFLAKCNEKDRVQHQTFSQEVLELFINYNWPGNVRELKNVVENAVVFSKSRVIQLENLPSYMLKTDSNSIEGTEGKNDFYSKREKEGSMEDYVKEIIESNDSYKDSMEELEAILMREYIKKNPNKTRLAKEIGISRQSLINKLKKYGIITVQK